MQCRERLTQSNADNFFRTVATVNTAPKRKKKANEDSKRADDVNVDGKDKDQPMDQETMTTPTDVQPQAKSSPIDKVCDRIV